MIDSRLLNLFPKMKFLILKVVFYKWFGLIVNILFLISIQKVVDQHINNLMLFVFLQLVFIMLKLVAASFMRKASTEASTLSKTSLRLKLYEKLLLMGPSYMEKTSTSNITQLITDGVDQLEVYFGLYVPQFFYAMLAPLTLFIVLSFYSLKVAFLLLLMVPLIPLSIIFVQKIAKKILKKYWGSYIQLGNSFLDSLQGLTTLKAFNMDKHMHDKINDESETFRKATMRVLVMQLNSISVMDLVAYGGAMHSILMAYQEYGQGKITIGIFLLFVLISSEFFVPMRMLGSYFHIAMNGATASDQMFEFLNVEIMPENNVMVDTFNISAVDLNFFHGDKQILYDVNFEIKENTFVSFVGESGSGKSTLLSLISNHLKQKGSLFIDGKPMNDLNVFNLRKHIVLLSSKSQVFKGTIRSNLVMSHQYDDDALIDVLKKVKLFEYIESNEGLDSIVLERGSNLSGGEKQRLVLARALLADVPVYCFDEVTSNIDQESEAIIMDVITSLKNKTIVFVSHRLMNGINSDWMYVLAAGSIVEEGNHDVLMERKGLYHKLYTTQLNYESFIEGDIHG